MRVQVRLKERDTDAVGDSPLQELFYSFTRESFWMDWQAFEAWMNQSGFSTSVCSWLSKQMSRIAAEVCNTILVELWKDWFTWFHIETSNMLPVVPYAHFRMQYRWVEVLAAAMCGFDELQLLVWWRLLLEHNF
jgi:hypothetical protein